MTDTTITDLEILLNALDSKDEQMRADAIRQARSLSPDALLTLSSLEVQHFRNYRRKQWRQAILLILAIYSPQWFYMWRIHAKLGVVLMWGFYIPLMMYFILPTTRIYINGYQPSQARRSLTSVLEVVEDVSFVPVALTLLQDKTKEITPTVTELLKRLLPQLHAGDAEAWTPQQYQMLLKLLPMPPNDTELVLCALKALEQLGDARALPIVASLANAPIGVTIRIQTAAQECLPYLQQRVAEQKQAQMLLRPADPHASGETLLRPTLPAISSTPDEQLLRPQQTSATDSQSR